MIIDLKKEQTFDYQGAPVRELTGYDNGSFMLTTEDKNGQVMHYAIDSYGSVVHEFQGKQGLEVITLKGGYYLRFERRTVSHAFLHRYSFEMVGTLFDASHTVVHDAIYGFKIFTNDWYVLSFGAKRALYNDKHQMVAEWFGRCFAFGDGYYAVQDDWLITSLERSWRLFKKQKQLGRVSYVEAFLGTSCLLLKNRDKKVLLYDLDGKELCRMPVVGYRKLLNNRFVLTFDNGTRRMYRPNGVPQGVAVGDETLLADGRFVTMDKYLVTGLYGRDGIVEKNCKVPTAVNDFGLYYYQLKWFDKNMLYDYNGNKLGEDYTILGANENFLLTERAGRICLFNQQGCVLLGDR